ncbi:mechanosensitive ion channel [candidate division KSB1 bacterium]|nr:mechanosensitive ion channel [candidate division KSB1 bacterium]
MIETIKQSIKELQFLQTVAGDLVAQVILFLPKLIASFVVLVLFWVIYRILKFVSTRWLKRSDISDSLINLITKIIKFSCLSLALVLVADQLGIKIIALISTLGVAGIALGLAAQQTLANFISGIIILVSKPFKEKDYVELEGEFGMVKQITLRSTTLMTLDNLLVDIPNQKIIESKIINHTHTKTIRLRIAVGIAYKEHIPDAQQVLLDVVKDDTRFLPKPAPEVVVTKIADSSINLELLVWIKDSRQEVPITYDLRKKVKMALDGAHIEIPFPHRQLFIDKINTDSLKELVHGNTKQR